MRRTSSIAVRTSAGVRPASASSSSSSRGSVASARAISSRLRPGVPSERAGDPARCDRPVKSSTSSALRIASARCGWRRKAPTMTFSTTVMSSNVTGTWKVRAMPSLAWASGLARVTSWSRKRIVPAVGSASPARQLKKVLLPAPLGPIRPTISPSRHVEVGAIHRAEGAERLDDAARLKEHAAPSVSVSVLPEGGDAAGLEAGDQQDDRAVDDEGDAGAAAAEHGVGGFLQRDQDDRADQRAEQRAGAAQGGDDQHLHRDQDAQRAVGVDEADHHRVERSGDRGEARRQQQRIQLVAQHRHAEAARRPVAAADRRQVIAHPAALHQPGQRPAARPARPGTDSGTGPG